MRLWHEELISKLPRQQLLGQHRECAALRGNGWGKPHATVDYVFKYSYKRLFHYHYLIMLEMQKRGYKVSEEWLNPNYRGKKCEMMSEDLKFNFVLAEKNKINIYPEHDDNYLQECLENLKEKGIIIKIDF
ncbi:TIGR02328 family protein [Domibacillus mangrovi]|uniref:Pyrimidine dimer DNA glycosylase n=1 Tax=Domibacillus mangrovi TaxID=1714354 RepID=A0A1Q5NZW2_9BACI|nr:TIGR02328 family protein [Domibacillus mangrovi]OKL35491.1 hypothetical protein BLL40_15140 [Domibacillus mangrovi]